MDNQLKSENMELLSLPRRNTLNLSRVKPLRFKSGLPINSLPGWESIPLNSKLPMLRCPGNQVVFSRNKIGLQGAKYFLRMRLSRQEFDSSGREGLPEYNSLLDSHLRVFYSNERNLTILRKNGEITRNNDVICNLKDFNEHRKHLHKAQLYYLLTEMRRLDSEQRDRAMIVNAENITRRDHRNLSARNYSLSEIRLRREQIQEQRAEHFRKLLEKSNMHFIRINARKAMDRVLRRQRREIWQLNMERHTEIRSDIERKQLIQLKKLFKIKRDRLARNLRRVEKKRIKERERLQDISWEKRLHERITNQKYIKILTKDALGRRKIAVDAHLKKNREKWEKIEQEIEARGRQMNVAQQMKMRTGMKPFDPKKPRKQRRKKKPKKVPKDMRRSFCSETNPSFEKIMGTDLCKAVDAAIEMETNAKVPFNQEDPIYKAAKFIMQHIIAKFDKDLSDDKVTFARVSARIEKFLEEAKKFIIFRATQIIASCRNSVQNDSEPCPHTGSLTSLRDERLSTFVSFCQCAKTVGQSSYEIHPLMDVKSVTERAPTPAGSLASIIVESEETLAEKIPAEHLCRNELIFIEHFITKFKRDLIVGVGKRVFGAIQCHFDDKIMDVKKELLNIDKHYLTNEATKSILSYAINPLNFDSSVRICISSLSTDIIWSLQRHLLRPKRDPRVIVSPQPCKPKESNEVRLCQCLGRNLRVMCSDPKGEIICADFGEEDFDRTE